MGPDFAILALPRSRTAWLAAYLSACHNMTCFHDGVNGCGTQREYLRKFGGSRAWGDSGPSLLFYQEWLKDSRRVVIERREADCWKSFKALYPSADRGEWEKQVALFEQAKAAAHAIIHFEELDDFNAIQRAFPQLWLCPGTHKVFTGLHITEKGAEEPVIPPLPPVQLPVVSAMERFAAAGGDPSGLTVRKYQATDRPLVSKWLQAHGHGEFTDANLPNLGLIVEDAAGPIAALWCYESFGVGVGHLTAPISRPGLTAKQAWNALGLAVCACVDMAGKWHEPEGDFRVFHCATLKPIARYLKRLGFKESIMPKVSMSLQLS